MKQKSWKFIGSDYENELVSFSVFVLHIDTLLNYVCVCVCVCGFVCLFLLIHNHIWSELGNENIPAKNQGETPLGRNYVEYTKTNLASILKVNQQLLYVWAVARTIQLLKIWAVPSNNTTTVITGCSEL